MAITALSQNVEMATVLKQIIEDKQKWLTHQQEKQPLERFRASLTLSDRDFYHALDRESGVFILECKKASPSKGLIRADFNLAEIANVYKRYASAISVLTDEKYFQGSFEFLPIVRNQVSQPILCKDFIIDEYQIYLARYYQADAILLMLSVVSDDEYLKLAKVAHQLKMGILTEASTEKEVERAIALDAKVIGINNRNLRDLSVDLNRTQQLSAKIPHDRIVISESGLYTRHHVIQLSKYANGFLIGSALMSEPNLTLAVRKMVWGEHKVCGLTRAKDAIHAYQAGAVYGGLIFVPTSARYIEPVKARAVMASAPLNWVGVFKDAEIDDVCQIATQLSLHAVQLHGNENTGYIETLRKRLPQKCLIWKALTIEERIPTHDDPNIARYIFDHGTGGTGKSFNWDLLQGHDLSNVILAGGINLQNITLAINTGCIGVDINSGVETSPGIKDGDKINQLFQHIQLIDNKGNQHG